RLAERHELRSHSPVVGMRAGFDLFIFFRTGIKSNRHERRLQAFRIKYVFIVMFFEDREGEWHPEITVFDRLIDFLNCTAIAGIRKIAWMAQRSRTEFGPVTHYRHDVALGDKNCNLIEADVLLNRITVTILLGSERANFVSNVITEK